MEMMEPPQNPTILLNGNPHALDRPASLDDFIGSLGLTGRPVVVELNQQAIFPRDYSVTQVVPGDRIEIVALAAGG